MKAPYSGMFRAVAVLALALNVAALQPDGSALAADPAIAVGFGPSVAPLARPGDGPLVPSNSNIVTGYVPSPAYTPNFSPDQTAPAAMTESQAVNASAANIPAAPLVGNVSISNAPPRFAADQNLPLVASGPSVAQPSVPNSASNVQSAAPAKAGHSPWQPIQAAFRQFTDTKSDSSPPAPAADVVPSQPNVNAPGLIDPGSPVRATPRLRSVRASSMQPMPGDPTAGGVMNSTPGTMTMPQGAASMPQGTAMMQPGAAALPPGVSPIPPTAVEYEGPNGPPSPGDCGCNGGGGCPNLPEGQAACPNCGGWKPCSTCTHDPEGSTILQRLACRITRPRPDCSNGCVDFCDSWLFHENDWWATSNHKCPAEGCGPWPYGGCETDSKGKGNGCGCGNCGFCIPPPNFYFSAEAMALTRDNEARSQNVVLNGTMGVGTAALKADQVGFDDWSVGPSFILGYRPTPKDFWELTYFGLQDFKDTESPAVTPLTVPSDLGTGGATAFFNASTIDVTYTSRINNAEVNYYWYPGSQRQLSFLSGFRYFSLDERFELNATGVDNTGTPVQSFYDIHSVNNLYGWQLGARWKQCGNRFGYAITGKAGAFGNDANEQQVIGNVEDPVLIRPMPGGVASTDEVHWAFVGQVDLTVTYRVAKGWEAIAGYNAMWLEGVALAPDQLDFTLNPRSGSTMHADGELFMHGGHVGLAYRW